MRIRSIKPEFFLHEGLAELEKSTKLPVRVAFAGLWCAADREGRFKWQPRKLGVQIVPYDEVDFSRVLHALATRGFVRQYSSGGEEFGYIPGFARHQVVNNRERDSELPEPLLDNESDACPTRAPRVDLKCDDRKAEGKGKEQGKEGNKEAAALSVLESAKPETSTPKPSESKARGTLDDLRKFAVNDLGIPPEDGECMFNHWESNGWRIGSNPVKDWRAGMRKYKSQGWLPSLRGKSPLQLSSKPTPPPL